MRIFEPSDPFNPQNFKKPTFSNPCPTYTPGRELTESCQSDYQEYSKSSLDPALHINSSKSWLTVKLYYCNYSNYDVRTGRYSSLINARGQYGIGLQAVGCNFVENTMTVMNTGVFYFTEGPHEVDIQKCLFKSNQGADATIIGGTLFTLNIADCDIYQNTANSRFGQIYLSGRTSGNDQPSFTCQNVIFYNNRNWPILNQQNIALLTNFRTVYFTNCSFTVENRESTSMVGLKGIGTSITFTDCCFYIDYTFYLNYYHVKFETSATGTLQFRGTNSFSGAETYAYNKNCVRADTMVFNIEKCINNLDPTVPVTSDSTGFTEDPTVPVTSDSTGFTEDPTYSITPTGDDSSGESKNDPFEKPFFIVLIILAIILIIIAFCLGYYFAKKKRSKRSQTTELHDSLMQEEPSVNQKRSQL